MKSALLNLRERKQAGSALGEAESGGLRLALILAFLLLALPGRGQDIEPRRWSHLPIGANFGGAAYADTSGDISLDPTLKIENGQFALQTIAGKYIRSLELFGKSARIDLTQTYQIGHWTGLLNGVSESVRREGWGDTNVRFAISLLRAPPLAGSG